MSRFGQLVAETTDPDAYRAHARTAAFRRKVDQAKRSIEEAARVGKVSVSLSLGKDSIAATRLVLDVLGGDTQIIHMDSSYKLPGWEPTRDYFAEHGRLHVIPAKRSLAETIEWLRDVGLCYDRETKHATTVVHRMKRDAASDWCEEHGFSVQILGLRADESNIRRMVLRKRGLVYQLSSGQWRALPLGWWSVVDVWALIFSRDLPYPRLYDCESHGYNRETLRNTGWLTTIDAPDGRIAWLRHWFPEQYAQLVAEFPWLVQLR